MEVVKKYFKTLPIALIVVVVLLAVVIGLGAAGVNPLWPCLFWLFYFTTFAGMDLAKIPGMIIGGVLGLGAGFLTIWFGPSVGTILLLVCLLLLLTAGLTSNPSIPVLDAPFMFLFLTLATGISGLPLVGADEAGAAITAAHPAANIWISFAVGILVALLIGVIAKAVTSRSAKKAAAGEQSA